MEKIETPNHYTDRHGEIPQAIVIHVTEGSYESAKSWIQKIESAVSYHIIVDTDGYPHRFVEDHEAAWANGIIVNPTWTGLKRRINPNLYTLSLAYSGTAQMGPTLAQVLSMAEIISNWSKEWDIPLDKLHIIPHNAIRGDKLCPGKKCDVSAIAYLASLLA